jgi:hypothetical protein
MRSVVVQQLQERKAGGGRASVGRLELKEKVTWKRNDRATRAGSTTTGSGYRDPPIWIVWRSIWTLHRALSRICASSSRTSSSAIRKEQRQQRSADRRVGRVAVEGGVPPLEDGVESAAREQARGLAAPRVQGQAPVPEAATEWCQWESN